MQPRRRLTWRWLSPSGCARERVWKGLHAWLAVMESRWVRGQVPRGSQASLPTPDIKRKVCLIAGI